MKDFIMKYPGWTCLIVALVLLAITEIVHVVYGR